MKNTRLVPRVKVSADGRGVVSHAGVGLLREMAQATGLVSGVNDALMDTYSGIPFHAPGQVFADLAAAIADGADAVSGIAVLRDRQELFGPVASMPTTWRLLDRIDAAHLPGVRAARAAAENADASWPRVADVKWPHPSCFAGYWFLSRFAELSAISLVTMPEIPSNSDLCRC